MKKDINWIMLISGTIFSLYGFMYLVENIQNIFYMLINATVPYKIILYSKETAQSILVGLLIIICGLYFFEKSTKNKKDDI